MIAHMRVILPTSCRVLEAHRKLEACPRYRILHTVAWSSFFYAHLNPRKPLHEELEYQIQDAWNRNDDLWDTEIERCRNLFDAIWRSYGDNTIYRRNPDCSVVSVVYIPTGVRIHLFEFDCSDVPF